jgi:hypothetical protein
MYIQASSYERVMSIRKITNPEHGILDVVRELYAQIRDLEGYQDEEDIDHLDIDLNILFNNEDNEFEDNYENLQKLKYFLKFHTEVFARLQKEQYLRIWTQHDPMYSIEIQYRHDGYALEAYSNIDNDYMWDKIMEYVE